MMTNRRIVSIMLIAFFIGEFGGLLSGDYIGRRALAFIICAEEMP